MPPVKHGNKKRVPLDLEPGLMEHVQNIAKERRINRTQLLRILIKYGIEHVEDAIAYGDKIWLPK